ncbi:MAG: thioredoxin domain-containing protein [Candidatus Micrarchaeota archaeon]
MIFCIVALVLFAVLGIFSAAYRELAKEAFKCMTFTLTFRPCETKFDEKLQATIVASIFKRSPAIAAPINRHFQLLSTLFSILFFGSMIYSGIVLYNYAVYGNCNGPQGGVCFFDQVLGKPSAPLLTALPPGTGPTLGNGSATLVEVGCFSCHYTRAVQPALKQFLAAHPDIQLEFRMMPILAHNDSFLSAQAAYCANEQNKFWPMHDDLFLDLDHSRANLEKMAANLSLDPAAFSSCLDSSRSSDYVNKEENAARAAGVYGTPTFFFGNQSLVSPQSEGDFERFVYGKDILSQISDLIKQVETYIDQLIFGKAPAPISPYACLETPQ